MKWTSSATNNSRLGEVLITINSETSGFLGLLILMSLFLILFVSIQTPSLQNKFAASSFITAVAGALLWKAGIVNDGIAVATIVMAVLGMFWLVGGASKGQ